MKTLLSFCALLSVGISTNSDNAWKEVTIQDWNAVNHREAFEGWKKEFNKQYTSIEDETNHYKTFIKNWLFINEHNLHSNTSYTLKLNQFGDLNSEQFKYYVHGKTGKCAYPSNIKKLATTKNNKKNNRVSAPTSIDWSQPPDVYVTPVKNQGSCGSCWAFSAVGSIESQTAIATKSLISLSEQQLVDCSDSYGNEGCDGGWMDNAFQYVIATGGLCTEESYPYLGYDSACQSASCTFYDAIVTYTDVTQYDEDALQAAVVLGPVSVAIEADQSAFQFYNGGVIDGGCGVNLDHGVLVVGYGVDSSTGINYWKVKNSWGTSWGDDGYVYICRDCNQNGVYGECGINSDPSYPDPK